MAYSIHMKTTKITKDSLTTMSLKDVRAELARQEAIRDNAEELVAMCIQAIADRVAEFKVGDLVVDRAGAIWQVTRIGLKPCGSAKDRVEYRGRRIKKDGSAGVIESEIYRCPLRAADSGNSDA